MAEKEKWIIDTDPGCDDMMAILYMMNQPNIEILMIGTIDGNVSLKNTTNNTKKIMKWSGKSIPIHQGSSFPIVKVYENTESYHYFDGLGEIDEIMNFSANEIQVEQENSALKYVELILKHPNQINLLLIGPLTNIATAYMLNPEIVNLVKSVYIMGGSTHSRGNHNCMGEFNFAYDFVAAKIVMSSFKNIILTPWEATECIYIKDHLINDIKSSLIEANHSINENVHFHSNLIVRKYSQKMSGIQLCDLYCAMSYFCPKSVKEFFIGQVDINIDSKDAYGAMVVIRKKKLNNEYGNINHEVFKKLGSDHHIIIEKFHEKKVFKELEIIFLSNPHV